MGRFFLAGIAGAYGKPHNRGIRNSDSISISEHHNSITGMCVSSRSDMYPKLLQS